MNGRRRVRCVRRTSYHESCSPAGTRGLGSLQATGSLALIAAACGARHLACWPRPAWTGRAGRDRETSERTGVRQDGRSTRWGYRLVAPAGRTALRTATPLSVGKAQAIASPPILAHKIIHGEFCGRKIGLEEKTDFREMMPCWWPQGRGRLMAKSVIARHSAALLPLDTTTTKNDKKLN